ncbi:3-deoxy-D-manno-octulosonic acid transferase [Acidovorax sp. HDW3]|uniref:3-deoxy-D-manno-octulosonic acid transferase n=1 Tax=Acidovorax sp. HDW3 TaxID=2714923 RepID=UPI00140B1B24|nr:3-deoxy-D-manno-octulosonic acid transferase [Acidovorax sp. HDW3]QIL45474.1 3-deoxy-D-manno-octulosonic acid transferase [Acidovorax sp. HDW3]
MRAVRWLYSALAWAAQPLLRRKLRRRALAEPGYAHAVEERFGHYHTAPTAAPDARPLLWLHAVSLGETRAAAILLQALRAQWPDMRLLLTHGTATGRAEGAKLLQPGDVQAWLPWDTPGAVRRFLRHFRPQIGVLLETEVWPNLIAACHAQGLPLVLANARLNERSLRQAQRLGWLARPAYRRLAAVWAQTEADAARLRLLGAPVQGVFGNIKFDVQPDSAQLAQGRRWRAQQPRPVLLLASTREGEEALWLQALEQKRKEALARQASAAPDLIANSSADWMVDGAVQWLLVPRHPQRFDEVAALLQAAGLSVSRRSQWGDAPAPADVWLGDSLGEMPLYYGLADAALLGGSFAPLGGQNLIEAAACACPLLLGPHTFNFAQAAEDACAAGAAQRVADMGAALSAAERWLQNDAALAQARQAAQSFAQAHRGAAAATAQAVRLALRNKSAENA